MPTKTGKSSPRPDSRFVALNGQQQHQHQTALRPRAGFLIEKSLGREQVCSASFLALGDWSQSRAWNPRCLVGADATFQLSVRYSVVRDTGLLRCLSSSENQNVRFACVGWQDQINRGQVWDVVPGPNGKRNPKNGHCVYLCGYTDQGPVCVTWGQKQAMTWRYFTAYCDEAYSVVDNRDRFVKKSPIDLPKLDAILAQL